MSRKTQKFFVYIMIGIMLVSTLMAGVSMWF